MPEFTEFLQNAKTLSMKLTQHFVRHQGCFSFFSTMVPNNSAIEDAFTISLLAESLEQSNDEHLKSYFEGIHKLSFANDNEFENFKTNILVGIYLIKWFKYDSTVNYYINKPLIKLFQKELDLESPGEMDDRLAEAGLDALSQYCSYVYQNRKKPAYSCLYKRLGASIQLDIHKTRKSNFTEDSSWYGVYVELMHTVGMNKMS